MLKVVSPELCLLCDKVKLDIKQSIIISNLKNKDYTNFTFDEDENIWYYQNYKSKSRLIDLLFPDVKIGSFEFINKDFNDYRNCNIEIILDDKYNDTFKPPENVKILKYGTSHKILEGRYAGQYRNMYWKIKDSEKEKCVKNILFHQKK